MNQNAGTRHYFFLPFPRPSVRPFAPWSHLSSAEESCEPDQKNLHAEYIHVPSTYKTKIGQKEKTSSRGSFKFCRSVEVPHASRVITNRVWTFFFLFFLSFWSRRVRFEIPLARRLSVGVVQPDQPPAEDQGGDQYVRVISNDSTKPKLVVIPQIKKQEIKLPQKRGTRAVT